MYHKTKCIIVDANCLSLLSTDQAVQSFNQRLKQLLKLNMILCLYSDEANNSKAETTLQEFKTKLADIGENEQQCKLFSQEVIRDLYNTHPELGTIEKLASWDKAKTAYPLIFRTTINLVSPQEILDYDQAFIIEKDKAAGHKVKTAGWKQVEIVENIEDLVSLLEGILLAVKSGPLGDEVYLSQFKNWDYKDIQTEAPDVATAIATVTRPARYEKEAPKSYREGELHVKDYWDLLSSSDRDEVLVNIIKNHRAFIESRLREQKPASEASIKALIAMRNTGGVSPLTLPEAYEPAAGSSSRKPWYPTTP